MDDPSPTTSSGIDHAVTSVHAAAALILTRDDIVPLMSLDDYSNAVESGFRALAFGAAHSPPPLHLHAHDGAFHAKGALLEAGTSHVAVKINSNFPNNPKEHGLPTIQGAIVLFDARDGRLLALLDSIEITLRRTAAASALAARYLARRDASTIAICGCGEQARAQVAALARELPLSRAYAWDREHDAAVDFAATMTRELALPITAVTDMREATLASDVIVTATTSRSPFLGPTDVRPGAFVAAIGADNPEKSELRPELMRSASVYVDVLEQCLAMGDLHHAVAEGAMSPDEVKGDLAELVSRRKPGRTGASEITIFDSTGTAVQDVAVAIAVHERARRVGVGTPLRLSGPPSIMAATGSARAHSFLPI